MCFQRVLETYDKNLCRLTFYAVKTNEQQTTDVEKVIVVRAIIVLVLTIQHETRVSISVSFSQNHSVASQAGNG